MNHILIKTWLQNPSAITTNDVEEIKKAIEEYPYFAALKVLLAKAENGAPEYVKSAAAYVSHRPSLQAFLDTPFDSNVNLPNTSGIEIENDEVETLDMLSSESISETTIDDNLESDTTFVESDSTEVEEQIEKVDEVDKKEILEKNIDTLNTEQEIDLEQQILKDLETTEDTFSNSSNEENETTASNSIADEVLAELARMSQGQPIEVNEDINEETLIESEINNNINSESSETTIDGEEGPIVSTDEILNRFQGFLDTRKKDESEIIDELSQEGDLDIFDLDKNISQTSYVVKEEEDTEITFDNKVVPVYDIGLPDDTASEQSYEQSLSSMSDDNIIDFSEFNPESELNSQQKIIDDFIKEAPTITPLSQENDSKDELDDLSEIGNLDNLIPKTESFAKMLEKQGKKEEAISIYQHLILKNPNKATFFAERIEFLQKN